MPKMVDQKLFGVCCWGTMLAILLLSQVMNYWFCQLLMVGVVAVVEIVDLLFDSLDYILANYRFYMISMPSPPKFLTTLRLS
jgi:hypothetical protein